MKLMAHVFYDETGELIDIKLTVGFKRDESVWSRSCLHRQRRGKGSAVDPLTHLSPAIS